jgi:integrase/recombinase XerD
MPLINCIPYLKDWLDNHPMKNIPTSPLICSTGKVLGQKIRSAAVREMYLRMKEYFTKLLEDPRVLPEDKPKICNLLTKPWNPYVFRHSALTEKSKMLKESHLRQHAGWSVTSNMPQVYLHYFGDESSSSILEAYGLKPRTLEVDKLKPKECPNCSTPNKIDTKFCESCGFGLTMSAWQQVTEQVKKVVDLDYVAQLNERLKALESKVK